MHQQLKKRDLTEYNNSNKNRNNSCRDHDNTLTHGQKNKLLSKLPRLFDRENHILSIQPSKLVITEILEEMNQVYYCTGTKNCMRKRGMIKGIKS